MTISIANLRYSSADNTRINMDVTIDGETIPFTYDPDDPNPLPQLVATMLARGSYQIAEYTAPNPVPRVISDRQFFQQLAVLGAITQQEALDAVKTGTIPAAMSAFISTLPSDAQFAAEMLLSGAIEFRRNHPLVEAFGAALNWTSEQIDQLWRDASLL